METQTLLRLADEKVGEFDARLAELKRIELATLTKRAELDVLIPRVAMLEEAGVLLQELAKAARQQMVEGLQTAGTMALQFVFGADLSFEVEVDTARNQTAIEFYVVDTSGKIPVRLRPEENWGGGVLDTLAIGMRYGMVKVRKPQPVGPMLLDEPAKMVSPDLVSSIGMLLTSLSKIFKKQTILVTHHEQLMGTEHTIFFQKKNGVSVCTAIYSPETGDLSSDGESQT